MKKHLHFELVKASIYYGRASPGWVVLCNGAIALHGTKYQCECLMGLHTGEKK